MTRFDQKVKFLCVLLSHELLHTKLYNTYIFYLLFISRQVQKSKNYENPTSTSKLQAKQFLLFCLTCFVFVIHLNLK